MIRYCDVHRLVRLRPSGECRLCTLEEGAKDAEARKNAQRYLKSRRKRNNGWELGGKAAEKFARMSDEWRGKIEAKKRPSAVIDDHPGYPVNNREQWAKDEAYRSRVGVRGYEDDLYKALPVEMRQFLTQQTHARVRHQFTTANPLPDVIGALRKVDWHLRIEWAVSVDGVHIQVGRAQKDAPPQRRGSRLQGMRERVHQPFFETLTQGLGVSTVHNNVQLFGQANIGNPDLKNMDAPAPLASDATYVVKAIHVDPPPGFMEALRGEGEDDD